jgi:nitroreductase
MTAATSDLDLRGAPVPLGDEALAAIGEAARWAPSIHNSQPWHLRRLTDGIAVLEDPTRALPVIDPQGRDRTISCGSAVLNARVALRALGYRAAVELLPRSVAGLPAQDDPSQVVAVVRAVGRTAPSAADLALEAAIRQRHTHRRVYRSHAVAEEDLLELRQAVLGEGARLTVADAPARRRLAHLLRRAVRVQAADAELRQEVERWVRRESRTRPGERPVDGIPSSALGTSPFPVDSLVHATHGGVPDAGEIEEELARSTVLAVSTRDDTRQDWVIAGMALEHMLLTATTKGLVATFTDQALQNPELRPDVAEVLGIWGRPQVLLRVGRALVEAPPTPRRPLSELFGD